MFGRLADREQSANLVEQVIPNTCERALSGSVYPGDSFMRCRMLQNSVVFSSKGNQLAIDREPFPLIEKQSICTLLGLRLQILFVVDIDPGSRVDDDKVRLNGRRRVSGAKHDLVLAILPVELPRSLEQLEEFADNFFLGRICKDAYHLQQNLAIRRDWRFMRTKPLLEQHQAKEDLVIVVPPGAVLLQ